MASPLPSGVGLPRAPGASPRRSDGGFPPGEIKQLSLPVQRKTTKQRSEEFFHGVHGSGPGHEEKKGYVARHIPASAAYIFDDSDLSGSSLKGKHRLEWLVDNHCRLAQATLSCLGGRWRRLKARSAAVMLWA